MRHLRYGGSSAKRTIGCPGWLEKSKNIPRRPAGQAAIDGSMHHEIMEMCQRDLTMPEDNLGFVYKENGVKREFTEDDLDLSYIAYNAINQLLDELDIDEMMIEPFVQMVAGQAGGSIDLLGLSEDRKTLLIADYKFGTIKVSPTENEQGGVYGVSVMRDKTTANFFNDVEKVVFAIVQPKVKGVVSTWETDVKWLLDFEQKFLAAMASDDINPGSHCKWCPAEPYCEEKRLNIVASSLLGARDKDDLQSAADVLVEVEDWLKSVKEELYLQLSRGAALQGWKIVDKRATRKWVDEIAVADALEAVKLDALMYKEPTLLTPPQMEKLVKKNKVEIDLDEFIMSTSSGTTLALADDSRDAVIVSDVQGHLADMME